MAGWIPQSIQKRLLRYALNRSGLLDVTGIDLDNVDISWGRRTTLEFKNVNLNVEYLAGWAQLPPTLHLESAKLLSLRLTIPADLFTSGVSVEADGVHVVAKLVEEKDAPPHGSKGSESTSHEAHKASHAKTNRRIQSPSRASYEQSKLPTTEDLAKSFLADEPLEERRELEAYAGTTAKPTDESIYSESSDGSDVGTGAAPGLPGFLSNWLQRLIDRFELSTRDVRVLLKIDSSTKDPDPQPVDLIARLDRIDLIALSDQTKKRELYFENFSIEVEADKQVLSGFPQLSLRDSPTASRVSKHGQHSEEALNQSLNDLALRQFTSQDSLNNATSQPGTASSSVPTSDRSPGLASALNTFPDQLQDFGGDSEMQASDHDMDIRMGEDNISWTSRKSQGNGPTDDPWNHPAEENLPESLILGMNRPLPPSHASVASSSPTRSRRPTSPYDRSFQGPGSWPRIDESPQRSRINQSPGSWPTLDQSEQSVFHSFTQSSLEESVSPPDGHSSELKPAAHEEHSSGFEASKSASANAPQVADLSQSQYFSHEDAQSIYMDAVTTDKQAQMPGAWESAIASNADLEQSLIVSGTNRDKGSVDDNDAESFQSAASADTMPTECHVPSGAATPRAGSPLQSETLRHGSILERSTLQLLYVDAVTVYVPQAGAADPSTVETTASSPRIPPSLASQDLSMSRNDIPGAFSTYSQLSRSQRLGKASVVAERHDYATSQALDVSAEAARPAIELHVHAFKMQADVSTVQLLCRMSNALTSSATSDEPEASESQKQSLAASLSIESLDAFLHQEIERRLDQDHGITPAGLLNLNCRRILVDSTPSQHDIRCGNAEVSIGHYTALSFDQNPQALTESMVFEQDVRVRVDTSKHTNTGRPIANVGAETRPIRIDLNLSAFDEVFSTFGGLSGVLDIGNSVAYENVPPSSPPPRQQTQRVRFQEESAPDTSPEFKANASVGGLTVMLSAENTAIMLQSATIKAVYREQAASVRFFGALRLSGPYLDDRRDAPIQADLAGLWLHYFFTPQEQDLERLLALITPSKDKYDNDDDILVDTLLRQRRKGACLRLTVDDAKVRVDEWECLNRLQALSAQVARFSAVAKYLPEDDRPGLLSLVRVKQVELRLPVNGRFGILHASFGELQCAHVGLPALLALSLSNVTLAKADGTKLIHPLVPLSGSDDLPMIMARMMDDEVEPVVKIKLYNVCVEYSVPILLDLTNVDRPSNTEEVVADLAASVADLALGKDDLHHPKQELKASKKTRLYVLLHHSAIGLAPHQTPAKALVILTDARLSTRVPPETTTNVKLELQQAGILLTDDRGPSRFEPTISLRNPSQSTVVKAEVLQALWKQGYVSVGSIMSAVIDTRIEKDEHTEQSSVEVDVRSQLLLLETCADSLQTLTVILGCLAPPTPPSKEPKYLTEPISLDDMISSFTGDAYAKPEKPAETLFDVDEVPEQGDSDMEDDLLTDADMDSSLYAPMMGDLDDGHEKMDQDYGETVESLLEDDPFEMTDSPDDMPFSDSALLRDLKQQALPAKSSEPVDLGNWEIEDLGFDALGVDEGVLGAGHRFSVPTSRRNVGSKGDQMAKLPFKLRLHDSNVTWHLHDGYDWQQTRDGIATAVEQIEQRADERLARRRQALQEPDEEESTIGDVMFNSVYITIPNNFTETPDIRRGINRQIDEFASVSESVSGMSRPTAYSAGGRPICQTNRRRLKLERSRYHKISFELSGFNVDVNAFPPESGELQNSVEVRVKQFEIFDNMPSSTWRKFLTRKHIEGSQEIARPMVHLELLNRRTIQSHEATDLMIHVAVHPLRLHVDQDALDFITRFFEFKDHSSEPSSASDQPFLSRVEIDTVDLQLDYKPKKVDYVGLRSGHTTEFMNFVILDQANIQLRHAIVYGIRGFEPLHKTLNDVWMPDVKRNQLPTILAGLAPVRGLVNIGTGMRDVVAIPIREYKKDGRIMRSVRKGALHFGKTTTSEFVRLGAKVAMGTQNLLSGAEGLLSPQAQHAPQSSDWTGDDDMEGEREPRAFSAYADQPLGVLSGLKSARGYLERDLLTAKDALIAVQGEIMESPSPGSAAMAMARHAPTVMLRPVIGASRALGTTLLGVGNQIDRGGIQRMEDKYKPR